MELKPDNDSSTSEVRSTPPSSSNTSNESHVVADQPVAASTAATSSADQIVTIKREPDQEASAASSSVNTESDEAGIVDCAARKRKAFSPSTSSSFALNAVDVQANEAATGTVTGATDFATVVDSSAPASKIARLVANPTTLATASSQAAVAANQAQIISLSAPGIGQQFGSAVQAGIPNNLVLRPIQPQQLHSAGGAAALIHQQQVQNQLLRAQGAQIIQNPSGARVIAAQPQQASQQPTIVLNTAVAAAKQLASATNNHQQTQQQQQQVASEAVRPLTATSTTSSHNPINSAGRPTTMSIQQKDTTYTKIFVGGLPYHTTDSSLREYFTHFGDIEEAVVITDRQTGKSRGYGFVTMADKAGADRACKDPNPVIDGRKANVNLAYIGAKPRVMQTVGLRIPQYVQANQYSAVPAQLYQYAAAQPTAAAYVTANGVIIPAAQAGQAASQQLIDYSGSYLTQLPTSYSAADVASAIGTAGYTNAYPQHIHHHTALAATSVAQAGPQLIAAPTQAAGLSVPTAATYQNLPAGYAAANVAAAYAATGPFGPAQTIGAQAHLTAAQSLQHATAAERF